MDGGGKLGESGGDGGLGMGAIGGGIGLPALQSPPSKLQASLEHWTSHRPSPIHLGSHSLGHSPNCCPGSQWFSARKAASLWALLFLLMKNDLGKRGCWRTRRTVCSAASRDTDWKMAEPEDVTEFIFS